MVISTAKQRPDVSLSPRLMEIWILLAESREICLRRTLKLEKPCKRPGIYCCLLPRLVRKCSSWFVSRYVVVTSAKSCRCKCDADKLRLSRQFLVLPPFKEFFPACRSPRNAGTRERVEGRSSRRCLKVATRFGNFSFYLWRSSVVRRFSKRKCCSERPGAATRDFFFATEEYMPMQFAPTRDAAHLPDSSSPD